jgi:hypothetical protein
MVACCAKNSKGRERDGKARKKRRTQLDSKSYRTKLPSPLRAMALSFLTAGRGRGQLALPF